MIVSAALLAAVLGFPRAGGISAEIASPSHNARFQSRDVAARGAVAVDVSLVAVSQEELDVVGSAGCALCVFVDGREAHCVEVSKHADALAIPSSFFGQSTRSWLHVELRGGIPTRDGVGDVHAASKPIAISFDEVEPPRLLSAVLTLTIDDAHRAMVLVASLAEHHNGTLAELIIVCPDDQLFAMKTLTASAALPTRHVAESTLFQGAVDPTWPKYALQMAIKLVVSRAVKTDFYVTLDADVVATAHLDAARLLPLGRSLYVAEPRSVHPHWWDGSASVLGLGAGALSGAAFGVTPALLSTAGARVVLGSLERRLGPNWEGDLLSGWRDGRWWSEYTLYRLALDERRLFDHLHAPEAAAYCCHPVWHDGDLPWDASAAFSTPGCVFSVVQSTTSVRPSRVAGQVHDELERRRRDCAA